MPSLALRINQRLGLQSPRRQLWPPQADVKHFVTSGVNSPRTISPTAVCNASSLTNLSERRRSARHSKHTSIDSTRRTSVQRYWKYRLAVRRRSRYFFGLGVGLGGTIIGLAASVWQEGQRGVTVLAVGIVLVLGSVIARAVRQ